MTAKVGLAPVIAVLLAALAGESVISAYAREDTNCLAAPGAQFTVYRTPAALRSIYGDTPTAQQFFVRFRLR